MTWGDLRVVSLPWHLPSLSKFAGGGHLAPTPKDIHEPNHVRVFADVIYVVKGVWSLLTDLLLNRHLLSRITVTHFEAECQHCFVLSFIRLCLLRAQLAALRHCNDVNTPSVTLWSLVWTVFTAPCWFINFSLYLFYNFILNKGELKRMYGSDKVRFIN
mgnify:CR=1 FL=1